jgi:hypothetical protein
MMLASSTKTIDKQKIEEPKKKEGKQNGDIN